VVHFEVTGDNPRSSATIRTIFGREEDSAACPDKDKLMEARIRETTALKGGNFISEGPLK
jgi:hypothetical protein